MKAGKTLQGLAVEIERQFKTKKDFIADTRSLRFATAEKKCMLEVGGKGDFELTDICQEQIASRLGIPQKYYEKMRAEHPTLLEYNVNGWFRQKPEKRLVRALDHSARAFLSDRYRPLDHYDLAQTVLPKLQKSGCRVESCEITERRLYIQAVTERITGKLEKGDIVQAGVVISNSEIGCGSVRIEPLLYRLVCSNGLIVNDAAIRQYHVGRAAGLELEGAEQFFRDSTRIASDRAFWMKVGDVVSGTLDEVMFEKLVTRFRDSKKKEITGEIPEVVEKTSKLLGFTDGESAGILRHLSKGGDLSQFGLVNAITRTAQDVESYDRSIEMQKAGWSVIELKPQQWESLSN